jgi:hypothetical protein
MDRTNRMRHVTKHGANRLRIEGRAIGGDALELQVAMRQRRLQSRQQGSEVIMGGIVIQDLIENPLGRSIVDHRPPTVEPLIKFIGATSPEKDSSAQSRKALPICLCAFFSRLDPVLDRAEEDNDPVVA